MYVGYPSTLVRKVISNEDLMYVTFGVVVMLDTQFLWCSLEVFLEALWKRRQKFGLKHFFVSGYRE